MDFEEKNLRVGILYDHYKDSFNIQREYLKQRDRLFLYVLLVIVGLFIVMIIPEKANQIASDLTSTRFGVSLKVTPHIFDSALWLLLVSFILKYFQNTIIVERQYDYLHMLEGRISSLLEEDGFSREGKAYVNNYKLFPKVAGFFYTIVFPVLLIIISFLKICLEAVGVNSLRVSFILDVVFFIAIVVITILYMISFHGKK